MQTLNISQIELNILLKNKIEEPVLLKNNLGNDYIIMPFSQENWQEVFLMLYKTLSEFEKKDEKQIEEKCLTAKEFATKWTGIIDKIEDGNIQNEFHKHLIEKYL